MLLRFAARASTRDVDAVILAPEPASDVRKWAREVGSEREWPEDWLNDGAKGFVGATTSDDVLYASAGITVYMPRTEQMLASGRFRIGSTRLPARSA
jgi:hypothetical protein